MAVTAASYILPLYIGVVLARLFSATSQQVQVMQSFSLLFLGATLATWATINFSLALVVGLLASPLSFLRPINLTSSEKTEREDQRNALLSLVLGMFALLAWLALSPPLVLYALSWYLQKDLSWLLLEIAKGWSAQGVWSNLVIWNIWWPAWVLGGVVLSSGGVESPR